MLCAAHHPGAVLCVDTLSLLRSNIACETELMHLHLIYIPVIFLSIPSTRRCESSSTSLPKSCRDDPLARVHGRQPM